MNCKKCKMQHEIDVKFCPNCGKRNKKSRGPIKFKLVLAVISLTILAVISGGYILNVKNYSKEIATLSKDIFISNSESTSVLLMYSDTWSSAIDKGKDFNYELYNLQSELEENQVITKIIEKQSNLRAEMEELNNPPRKYQKTYDLLKDQYVIYSEVVSQVDSPTGSLKTFNEKLNNLQTEFNRKNEEFLISMSKDVKKYYSEYVTRGEEEITSNISFSKLTVVEDEEYWALTVNNNNGYKVYGYFNLAIYNKESELIIYESVYLPPNGMEPYSSYQHTSRIENFKKEDFNNYKVFAGSVSTVK